MAKLKWTVDDDKNSFPFGWGMFSTDDGGPMVLSLDDPEGACLDRGVQSVHRFKGDYRDDIALRYVKRKAKAGNRTAIKALKFLRQENSCQAKRMRLY